MTPSLKVSGLKVSRGKFHVGPIDLEIAPGHVLGLVGPNGVGKTSLILAILGLIGRDAGQVEVLGLPADPSKAKWKEHLGVVLDGQGFYERLTVKENLRVHADLRPTWDTCLEMRLLDQLDLSSSKLAKHLSNGERQKLALVAAMAHRPRLLILDEATSGLDPVVRSTMIDAISDAVRDADMSILMTTHLMADIATLADHVAFMKHGSLAEPCEKDALLNSWRRVSFRYEGSIAILPGVVAHQIENDRHLLTSRQAETTIAALNHFGAREIEATRMSLEEIAVHILKEDAR